MKKFIANLIRRFVPNPGRSRNEGGVKNLVKSGIYDRDLIGLSGGSTICRDAWVCLKSTNR
ncbi:MAG: hypothetical protein LBL21_05085 [Rickettsiales bacterium]|jgi:hypothetical protein|nr:hypothetical protein [Rickettsiales bacterium]